MAYLIICSVALVASGLTLFSGFGLGTLLLPAFAIFFPVEMAIALTAVVHLLNNLFKLALLGKHTQKSVVWRFGLPAILTAFIGAWLLMWLSDLPPLFNYDIFTITAEITPVKLTIATLMILFAIFELFASQKHFALPKHLLPLGGAFSGFFGGLSGHQGALRSMFLLHCNLSREAFIASGITIACMVDVIRLFVYSERLHSIHFSETRFLLLAALISAFTGAFIGSKFIKKVTMSGVQRIVSVMLFILAFGLIIGII